MNRYVYNISLLVGVGLVGVGVGMWSLPAGLASAGGLILGLTVYGAETACRSVR